MTGYGRYLAAFTEHFPSRSWYDPPDFTERPDLDFASDYPAEVVSVIDATTEEHNIYDLATILTAEVIDQETGDRWIDVQEFMRDA